MYLKKIKESRIGKINSQFASPGTPQKNGTVRWGITTPCFWMFIMKMYTELNENLKGVIWFEQT